MCNGPVVSSLMACRRPCTIWITLHQHLRAPEAVEAMMPMFSECYANPSGAHAMARDARRRLDDARDILADGLGCQPGEIIYTGGGTEADNLAIFGSYRADVSGADRSTAVVCSAVEHPRGDRARRTTWRHAGRRP